MMSCLSKKVINIFPLIGEGIINSRMPVCLLRRGVCV
jgi:hypothetical protein